MENGLFPGGCCGSTRRNAVHLTPTFPWGPDFQSQFLNRCTVFVGLDPEVLTMLPAGCLTQSTNGTVLVRHMLPVEAIVYIVVACPDRHEHLWHRTLAGKLPNHVSRRIVMGDGGGSSSTRQPGGLAMPWIRAPTGHPYSRAKCPACDTQLAASYWVPRVSTRPASSTLTRAQHAPCCRRPKTANPYWRPVACITAFRRRTPASLRCSRAQSLCVFWRRASVKCNSETHAVRSVGVAQVGRLEFIGAPRYSQNGASASCQRMEHDMG